MNDTELRETLSANHKASFAWAVVCCRRDRDLAEEILQSAYLHILERRLSFAGKSSFKTWLFAVIHNMARDRVRGRWWTRAVRLDLGGLRRVADPSSTLETKVVVDEQTGIIRRALQKLPRRQAEIIHLVFYEGLTLAQAAKVMNISIGSVRRHYDRAKSELRKQLKQDFCGSTDETADRAAYSLETVFVDAVCRWTKPGFDD